MCSLLKQVNGGVRRKYVYIHNLYLILYVSTEQIKLFMLKPLEDSSILWYRKFKLFWITCIMQEVENDEDMHT
jgi:hypothetical protein